MARTQSFSRREERTAPAQRAAVPDLGPKITMPRKTNLSAAKTIASGDRFWDKRKVGSKARRRALQAQLAQAARTGSHRLSRQQKQWLENHLSAWSWDVSTGALKGPVEPTPEQLDELVAATRLSYVQRAVLKVQGLTQKQLSYVAERAPLTMRLVLVDPVTKGQQTVRAPRLV